MGRRARAHVHGCGGKDAARGVWASRGSGTGGREEGLQRSLPTAPIQTPLVYRRGIHKRLELALPKGKKKEVFSK